ncbi:MAG: HAMP domain-containing histidine kinase, partial [Acidobacteria bacterium]|nr:HAMP domain-containing histidine kinase [Acidobacteriota bacterium]
MSRTLAAEAAGLNVLVLVSPKRECARLARRLTAGLPHSCVVSASRMQEAVSALKTRRMHAVVCDLRFFPKMYAAVARQSAGDRTVPIIVLASERAEAQVAAALQQGAASFLVKAGDYGRVLPLVVERVAQVLSSWAEVGKLVRHEINNPLAYIAMCGESLEMRLHEVMQAGKAPTDQKHQEQFDVVRGYLRMIQDEAFRSKEITDRLLDFSRQGDCEKHRTDLVELVQGVIAMVRHLGKYRNLHVVFNPTGPVEVEVNPQEIKQVVLNLITNSLEALEAGGTVEIELSQRAGQVELVVRDDGCGMTEEVLAHIFEPFFTSRASGQGTGLGLAITH